MPNYRSIVAAVDFSPCSAVALAEAMRISKWSGAALHVVHVIDTLVVIEIEEALTDMQKGIREGLVSDAEAAWRTFAATVPGAAGLPIEVAINNRIVGIQSRARVDKADLIVLGAYGDRSPDLGVGSVATACVRKSACDVLLVRETRAKAGAPAEPFRTVVAAVDFSPTSLRALERAAGIAAADGAALHVLHVFSAPWQRLHYRAPTPETAPSFKKQYLDALSGRLAEFAKPVLALHPGVAATLAVHEHPGHRSGIVDYATGVSADLIALGTRGRTNVRDILLGSTAERALAESRCSVLAVKPEGFDHPIAREPAGESASQGTRMKSDL